MRIIVAILLLSAFLQAQPVHTPGSHRLVIIAVAGLDARFLAESPARVKAPHIRGLMRSGASASGVVGVAPSDTWPSGISLVTGVKPADSGNATPLWRAASQNGLKTAAVDWPGTIGAEIAFNFPAAPEGRRNTEVLFDDVAGKSSPPGIVDRIEKASPGFQKELWDDRSAAQAAAYLLRVEKPDLLLVQLTDLDSEQRETGALSSYSRDTLENEDDLIGQILAAGPTGTIVALVSGHGFENENYIVRPRVLLRQGRQRAADVPVEVVDGLIGATDPAAAETIRSLMKDGHRHGLAREVPMAEVRARASAQQTARWTAAFDTPANYVASDEDRGPALGHGSHLGVSGLWPTRPGYRSVFVISGEGIGVRKLGEIDLLQIAPTLADAIGVRLPQAKERSLWPAIGQ